MPDDPIAELILSVLAVLLAIGCVAAGLWVRLAVMPLY